MERRTIKSFSAWAIVAACLSLSTVLWAKEEFQARLLTTSEGLPAEKAMKIKISVESYTSREEVLQLMEILSQRGYEPFMSAFRGMNKGSFRPIGGRGVKINLHAAQSIQTDKGRQILLFTQRQSWDVEARQRIDSRFSFMVIELNIDNKGKGKGKIYEQANILLTPQGTIEMESYNSPPRQLFDVRALE